MARSCSRLHAAFLCNCRIECVAFILTHHFRSPNIYNWLGSCPPFSVWWLGIQHKTSCKVLHVLNLYFFGNVYLVCCWSVKHFSFKLYLFHFILLYTPGQNLKTRYKRVKNTKYCYFIGIIVREFANGPGDLGLIPGRVRPKTQKMVLDVTLLNTQHYKVRVKWSNLGTGEAPYLTPWCSSYRKESIQVTLNYGRQLSFFLIERWLWNIYIWLGNVVLFIKKLVKILMLYFDLWPSQKCHSKVMHQKEVTHSSGSYERKSRGRKLADEMGRGKKFPW